MEVKRRPIKARESAWAKKTARLLLSVGFNPNQISILSAVFGCAAGALFWFSATSRCSYCVSISFIGAAACIQLRLLCNLFDGMLAVEGGLKSKSGELYNELPDRISDLATLIGAGYAVAFFPYGVTLGWIAGSLAVLTAYIRTLGVAAGAPNFFVGPCAKQQRMAIMTGAAIFSSIEHFVFSTTWILWVALLIVAVGSLITCMRRLKRIANHLESNAE